MNKYILLALPLAKASVVFSAPAPYNENIRGTYENKIRQNANPEKVFETFASIKERKNYYMSVADFFKAITPYNYSSCVNQNFFDSHESLVFKIADANGDGKLSFSEYFFFIVLLSTGAKWFKEMFKSYGGTVTREQFIEIMKEAKKRSPQGKHMVNTKGHLDPRSSNVTDEQFRESCLTLSELFFKNDKNLISWREFMNLKNLIMEELLYYEFHAFEVDEDMSISSEDFAKSIISYMPVSKAAEYLRRLETLKLKGRVKYSEYMAFMIILQQSKRLENALLFKRTEHGRALSRKDIKKVLAKLCKDSKFCRNNGLSISDIQIKVFVELLDLDDSGFLEPEEFFNVLVSRDSFGTAQASKPDIDLMAEKSKEAVNFVLKYFGFKPYFAEKSSQEKITNKLNTLEH
ncbi:unnamed protein product [Blepharisma stoltei]|uniref:EF-hand domain-containing protein n=1 Tax=Blepharisma stoltei TaxID=1481888 RepID=A0AAU9ILA3_9CILI|nr:unnamed protein product [Blepharisma stoltei]